MSPQSTAARAPADSVPAILAPLSWRGYPGPVPHRINLHLVSDATGETLNSIARATVAQFEHADILHHRWSLVRTRFQLHRVLEGIEAEPGPVLSTLVERGLRAELESACQRHGVPVVHVLDPVMALLQEQLEETAVGAAGAAIRAGRGLLPPHRRDAFRAGA